MTCTDSSCSCTGTVEVDLILFCPVVELDLTRLNERQKRNHTMEMRMKPVGEQDKLKYNGAAYQCLCT